MKVNHVIEKFNEKVSKKSDSDGFILSNKNQGFAWLNSFPNSRYNGIFFNENNRIFRIIESINPNNEIIEITNKLWCIERESKDNKEIFFMPDILNSIIYESKKPSEITLDFKEAYANDNAVYNIEKYENLIIIKIGYNWEDFFLVIKYEGTFDENKQFIHRIYSYDSNRKSYPNERDIFSIGRINSKKIVFFFSKDLEYAKKQAEELFNNTHKYKKEKKERIEGLLKNIPDKNLSLAYNSCKIQLDNLSSSKGLYAGLPWFFQYWSRDELICLEGLEKNDKNLTKEILLKWMSQINKGWNDFPAKFKVDSSTEGLSIDALGWLLKRIELFPEVYEKNKNELDIFFKNLNTDFIKIYKNTWMDSIERIDPIEIQVMKLYALRLGANLTNNEKYRRYEKNLKEKILDKYYKNNILYDSEDKKIRPNIFIVYYFYPYLLTKKEWEICFDNLLDNLWLSWGGLSTISKNDYWFHENYSGEAPGSYHNGDSWFWINNLTALVLADLNKEKYYDYIQKIISASTKEILFMNAIGNHAELSSASDLNSEGAPCQAFSAAIYLELIDKIMSEE